MWKLPWLAPLQQGFWSDPCRANSGCIAWPGTGWEPAGLTRDQTGSSRELAESLGLGIYFKPMRPIQKSISGPIRVIPNKSEASFNPY